MTSHNFDLVAPIEPICCTYKEAKAYLEKNQTAFGYICSPIILTDEDEERKFKRRYMVVDHFQSGKVMYVRR
jgi:hypothetical protein